MRPPRLVALASTALVLVAVAIAGCDRRDSDSQPGDEALPRAVKNAPGQCPPDGGWFKTTLQLSQNDTGQNYRLRKGTEYVDCWWQWKPLPLRTYWESAAAWEICNACNLDVTVELSGLPLSGTSPALAGCYPAPASNVVPVDVKAGATALVDCGVSEVPPGAPQSTTYSYDAGAKVRNTAGPVVPVDPELEIERRGGGGPTVPPGARPDGPQ